MFDTARGQPSVHQPYRFVGMQHDGLIRRPVAYFDTSLEKRRRECSACLVRRDVELRTQHFYIRGKGLHDERVRRIVCHVETGFAFDAYPPGISCEQGGIFELRTGIQPNGRAVRKRHPYMLAGRYGHGQPLRTLLFQSAGFPIIITADKSERTAAAAAAAVPQRRSNMRGLRRRSCS